MRQDVDADLNLVDDAARNLARRPADVSGLRVGGVAIVGGPGFGLGWWSMP
jgi:hypothetical protein